MVLTPGDPTLGATARARSDGDYMEHRTHLRRWGRINSPRKWMSPVVPAWVGVSFLPVFEYHSLNAVRDVLK